MLGLSPILFLASCGTRFKGKSGRSARRSAACESRCSLHAGGGRRLLSRHGRRNFPHPDEIDGPEHWLVWTGGNDVLWDQLATISFGALDFLKTLSSHPRLKFSRDNRWNYLGLVNEPCFEKPTGPDPQRYGLWLDKRSANCPPDPFENEAKYPGVKIGARGKNLPAGSFYGYATGIVGLRLFPNPDFDEAAAKKWDPVRYYTDPAYYKSKDLIRPYRVGMSCAFCHVGPNPVRPPADRGTSGVGEPQLQCRRAIFLDRSDLLLGGGPFQFRLPAVSHFASGQPRYFAGFKRQHQQSAHDECHLLTGAAAGTSQTVRQRDAGRRTTEQQATERFCPAPSSPLAAFFTPPATVLTPRVLKDGSDSVGALGALNRVYLNIGLVQRGMAASLQSAAGRKAHHADRNRGGAQELGVLASHGSANSRHGVVLSEIDRAA